MNNENNKFFNVGNEENGGLNNQPINNNQMDSIMPNEPVNVNPVEPVVQSEPVNVNPVEPVVQSGPVNVNSVEPVVQSGPVNVNPIEPVVQNGPVNVNPVEPMVQSGPVNVNPVEPVVQSEQINVNPVEPVVQSGPVNVNPVEPVQPAFNQQPMMNQVPPVQPIMPSGPANINPVDAILQSQPIYNNSTQKSYGSKVNSKSVTGIIVALVAIVAVVFVYFVFLNKKTLSCTMSESSYGLKLSSEVNLTYRGKKLSSMDMDMEFDLGDDYADYKDYFMEQYESEFGDRIDEINSKGGKASLTAEGNSIILDVEASRDGVSTMLSFDEEEDDYSYDNMKEQLEDLGYVCK